MLKTTAIMLTLAAMLATGGCANSVLSGGGLPGKLVNDALPPSANIYAQEYDAHSDKVGEPVAGTEATSRYDLIWAKWDAPVPCSDIKGVDYWIDGEHEGEIGLPLVGARYGNKYMPPPPSGVYWLRPQLWVDGDYDGETKRDFTTQQAQHLADFCGVKLQRRR